MSLSKGETLTLMFHTQFGNGNFSLSRIWITNDEYYKHDPGK